MPKTRPQSDDSLVKPGVGPSPESIARRAYEIYERRGRTAGGELEDWLAAEAELRAAASPQAERSAEGAAASAADKQRARGSEATPTRRRPVERRP
jgi:hypothetical protein